MNLSSGISKRSKTFLVVVKDLCSLNVMRMEVSMLVKSFVDDAWEAFGSITSDNCGVVLFMEEYGDVG